MSQAGSSSRVVKLAALSAVVMLVSGVDARAAFDVVEKNIPQLLEAYTTGQVSVQNVVDQYLWRIRTYDDPSIGVNAVGQINPGLAAAVAQAQNLINGGATTAQYPLLGVPVLVKDSFDVQGMITTNGVSILNGDAKSSLSTFMTAPNDAPSIAALKAAGAIILGKTNMSTMAYSFSGIDNAHGVVRNPYNFNRQPGGSSSGSGAAAASNFAMLTMGGETGGSIRIPSAYNGVVGLKTSAGLVSPDNVWGLTPSRDVVGPMGKTVADMAYAMNALAKPTAPSQNTWINTPYYPVGGPQPGAVGTGLGEGSGYVPANGSTPASGSLGLTVTTGTRPVDYTAFLSNTALLGKKIVVPSSVVRSGSSASELAKAYEATINTVVYDNFQQQLNVLRAQGATVVTMDVPAEVMFFSTLGANTPTTTGFVDKSGKAIPYPTTTTNGTTPSSTWSTLAAAYYYDKQVKSYNDPKIKNLRDFAAALADGANKGSGNSLSTLSGISSTFNTYASYIENGTAKGFDDANNDGVPDNADAAKALAAFTTLRQQYFNQWMSENGIDALVEPSMSGLAPFVDSSIRVPDNTPVVIGSGGGNHNGRFLGNALGLPALSVPSGMVGGAQSLWTGIQFIGRLDSEAFLMGLAYDYEDATHYRFAPNLSNAPEPVLATLIGLPMLLLRRRRRA